MQRRNSGDALYQLTKLSRNSTTIKEVGNIQ